MADTTTLPGTNGNHAQTAASETDKRILAELNRKQRVAALRAKDWRVELSGGGWAKLSDPELLPERKARAIKVAMLRSVAVDENGNSRPDPEATIDGGYVVIVAFLSAWSFGEMPAIGNVDRLLDLNSRDVAALSMAASDLREEAMSDFSPTPEALADQSSPFTSGSA